MLILWVDALCINQKDNAEKAHQIRHLPRIFQSALFTYAVWDTSGGKFDAVVEMLMQVQTKAKMQQHGGSRAFFTRQEIDDLESEHGGPSEDADLEDEYRWPTELPPPHPSWMHLPMPRADDPIWNSVEALFSRPWFRRAWAIQEAVASAAVRVVCGKWLVDFHDVHSAMQIIDREAQVSEDHRLRRLSPSWQAFLTLATQREWELSQHRWALLFLLEHFRHAKSTLCRDRFFALLGLALDANEPEFAPDYDSPLEAIALRFATAFVRQGRGLQMLSSAGLNAQSHRFPSWIPDWTTARAECLHESDQRATPFAASGPHEPSISKSSADSDELLVGGFQVDRVQRTSKWTNTPSDLREYLEEVDEIIEGVGALAVVPDSREDLKWKVPIAGVEYPKVISDGTSDLKASYTALRRLLGDGDDGRDKHTRNWTLRSDSDSYTSTLLSIAVGWRLFSTENGYIGVAPGTVEVGDVVAILKGGLVPFILRESPPSERPGACRLVGEGYVHGMIPGEGILLQGVAEREFRIY